MNKLLDKLDRQLAKHRKEEKAPSSPSAMDTAKDVPLPGRYQTTAGIETPSKAPSSAYAPKSSAYELPKDTALGGLSEDVPHLGIDETAAAIEPPSKGLALGNASKGVSHMLPKAGALDTGGVKAFEPASDVHAHKEGLNTAARPPASPQTNLPGVDHPKAAGYAPLGEGITGGEEGPQGPPSTPFIGSSMNSAAETAVRKAKPDAIDIGLSRKAGALQGMAKEQEPLLSAADASRQDKNVGGTTSGGGSGMSQKSDYTSALDKIASDDAAGGKSVGTTAQEYLSSSAQAATDKARELKDAATQALAGSSPQGAPASGGSAVDSTKSTVQAVKENIQAAAQGAHEAVKPYMDAATEKTSQAKKSAQETTGAYVDAGADKTGVENRGTKSTLQKAQEAIQTTAAAAAEKASQAFQAVQQKVQESEYPQKLADHTAAARDSAAAKVSDLSKQAQAHQQAAQDVAAQKLAEAKMQAQETVRVGQQKAAELARNVRDASVDDVNRSWVGRAMGAIVLLWLASVAVGIPFKYGLAAALLAVSAVLFLDWDHARRGGYPASSARTRAAPRVVHVRHEEQTYPTEFGQVKVHAGHIEKPIIGEHRFVAKPQGAEHPLIKEE